MVGVGSFPAGVCNIACQKWAGLKELTQLLEGRGLDAAIWLGDMNWEVSDMNIAAGWSDLWKETADPTVATFHGNQGASCHQSARFDRILTIGVETEGSSVALLGTSQIPGTNSFPSDHYGLFAAVQIGQRA